MSVRELQRVEVLARVKAGTLKVRDAAVLLGVCERQAKRLWRLYRRKGPAGLRHKGVGRRSNRAKSTRWRRQVVALYRKKYAGNPAEGEAPFGPTLAAEHMGDDDQLVVDPETLRRLLIAEGLWARQRKGVAHRQRRERKLHFGELVQIDGSFHAWLERRGPGGCLMQAIDDATGTTDGRLCEQETIWAAARILRTWVERYGIPYALYTDWKNVYLREATEAERAAGDVPRTQFGRMCEKLGIRIIGASSPQAKGRVERVHGTSQDRLVKKLRLKGICDHEATNAYLTQEYDPGHNARFARAPASAEDFHLAIPRGLNLDDVFRLETPRTLGNDWVVRHDNRYFQVQRQSRYAPARSTVLVCESEDGRVVIEYRGRKLAWQEIAAPAPPTSTATPRVAKSKRSCRPAGDHPWRLGYKDLRDGSARFHVGDPGYGNASGVDAPHTRAHPALEISRGARDSHTSTSP
jgi:transposase